MLLLSHTCDISRNTAVGTNGRRTMQAVYTGVSCLAIPMSQRTAISANFELGRGYDFFFNYGQDVKVGDQLSWEGDTYTVSAIQKYNLPMVEHFHVTAQQEVSS